MMTFQRANNNNNNSKNNKTKPELVNYHRIVIISNNSKSNRAKHSIWVCLNHAKSLKTRQQNLGNKLKILNKSNGNSMNKERS